MRLAFILSIITLTLVSFKYGYYTGHNQGSTEEKLFIKTIIVPLCEAVNPKDAQNLARCIQSGLTDAN
jgi:hypothetical protein